jgi:hypothetical protein
MTPNECPLVGKKVLIKWRRWRRKPELSRYKFFSILAIIGIGSDGWIQVKSYYTVTVASLSEPPIWLKLSDIDWMAEVEEP